MERGCSRVVRDAWLWNRKSPGGCEIETGFGNQATGKICQSSSKWVYSILFYPITFGGRCGTTDEFATIPFHLDMFSAAPVNGYLFLIREG